MSHEQIPTNATTDRATFFLMQNVDEVLRCVERTSHNATDEFRLVITVRFKIFIFSPPSCRLLDCAASKLKRGAPGSVGRQNIASVCECVVTLKRLQVPWRSERRPRFFPLRGRDLSDTD